jgi:nucleoid-associated protein YgaU
VAAAPAPAAPSEAPAVPTTAPAAAPPATAPESSSIPTLVAEPEGEPGSGRFASGKAIIRHGDNLWTIARRVYGSGLNYTTIYQANSDQIRDPHWIYPGQVFDLPKTNGSTSQ